MKYKIEIWRYRQIIDSLESDNVKELWQWFVKNYLFWYDYNQCTFYLYENGKEIDSFEKRAELGFQY